MSPLNDGMNSFSVVRAISLAPGRTHYDIYYCYLRVWDVVSHIFLALQMTYTLVIVQVVWQYWSGVYFNPPHFFFFNQFAFPAHRYHQAKASGQSQGGQSKSSSAHSSRSTSPGPHWRNDAIAPYKPPDKRSMETPSTPCASSSSTRSGRSRNPSGSSELDSVSGRTLLPQPTRDRSEPRHFNPLRWVCVCLFGQMFW